MAEGGGAIAENLDGSARYFRADAVARQHRDCLPQFWVIAGCRAFRRFSGGWPDSPARSLTAAHLVNDGDQVAVGDFLFRVGQHDRQAVTFGELRVRGFISELRQAASEMHFVRNVFPAPDGARARPPFPGR